MYTRLTGEYMGCTELDVIFAYSIPDHDSAPPALPDREFEAHASGGELRGILQTDEPGDISLPGAAVPLIGNFSLRGGVDVYREELLATIERERGDGPLFISGLINAWSWTPSGIAELVESLPEDVEVLLADEFFDLFARSGGSAEAD